MKIENYWSIIGAANNWDNIRDAVMKLSIEDQIRFDCLSSRYAINLQTSCVGDYIRRFFIDEFTDEDESNCISNILGRGREFYTQALISPEYLDKEVAQGLVKNVSFSLLSVGLDTALDQNSENDVMKVIINIFGSLESFHEFEKQLSLCWDHKQLDNHVYLFV